MMFVALTTTSCNLVPKFIKSSNSGTKQATTQVNKLNAAEQVVAQNNEKKLDAIGVYAEGTDHALDKVNTASLPPVDGAAVTVATQMNDRTKSLAGDPNIEEKNQVHTAVDQLVSDLVKERVSGEQLKVANAELAARNSEGAKLLANLDSEYIKLQEKSERDQALLIKQVEELKMKLLEQGKSIDTITDNLAQSTIEVDELKAELKKFDSAWGWYAIKHGVWIFVRNAMWLLTGFGVLFLILRIGAASNPIIGAIFSVFEQIAALFGRVIATMLPRVFEMAGHVKSELHDLKDGTLKKMVDEIQQLEDTSTIRDLKDELSKAFDIKEKRAIDDIKKALGYK